MRAFVASLAFSFASKQIMILKRCLKTSKHHTVIDTKSNRISETNSDKSSVMTVFFSIGILSEKSNIQNVFKYCIFSIVKVII